MPVRTFVVGAFCLFVAVCMGSVRGSSKLVHRMNGDRIGSRTEIYYKRIEIEEIATQVIATVAQQSMQELPTILNRTMVSDKSSCGWAILQIDHFLIIENHIQKHSK